MNQTKKKPMTSSETKRFDYVLVVKEENLPFLEEYFNNLKILGLEFANEKGLTVELFFVKVFISKEALDHFSELYEIGNRESWATSVFYTEHIFSHPFKNPVSRNLPDPNSNRTEAENIMILNKVLENGKFGAKDNQFGLSKLISLGIVETAYPLHDGSIREDGTNARSLLFYHWSNLKIIHMEQPLDLICRYFGVEAAFYFAWLEYFNIMLLIPAVLGIFVFLASLLYAIFGDPIEVIEICTSSEVMCPICEGWSGCRYKEIYKYCSLAYWTFIFDNNLTIAFAVFITFWSTLFISLWRRKEKKLIIRWNCEELAEETHIRQEFLDSTTHQRPNIITGEMEPYVPKIHSIFKYSVTITACVILLGIILTAKVIIIVLKLIFNEMCQTSQYKYFRTNSKLLTIILDSALQIIFIKMFQMLYMPASMKLTRFENPRTQTDFDTSVLYKKYLLSFMNNYIPLIYLAFIKGNIRSLPHLMNFLNKDHCQPGNCVIGLCIQLTFILTIKTLFGNIFNIFIPKIKYFFKKLTNSYRHNSPSTREGLSQCEKEYYLEPLGRYALVSEFSEMIIRYGFVAFFSNAFPLAAVCALLNNLLELRSDAYKFVKSHRRLVPIATSGIGPWIGVLRSLSYLSAAMNAFVLAFTSDWVSKKVYRKYQGNGSLKGYINSTLSKYSTKDYDKYSLLKEKKDYCYIRGYLNPPESSQKYQYSESYWVDLTFKIITIFVFEHVVLVANVILSYLIPFIPQSVREQLNLNEQKKRDARLAECKRKLEARLQTVDLTKSLQGMSV